MAIFNSYVKLPEGSVHQIQSFSPFGSTTARISWWHLRSAGERALCCRSQSSEWSASEARLQHSGCPEGSTVDISGSPSWSNQLRGQSAWDTRYSTIGIGSDGMWWVPIFSMMSSRTERCIACGVMKISATLEELHFLITYPLVIWDSHGKWPIEIDGLPIKNGDFQWLC